jgi:hypothetical protein
MTQGIRPAIQALQSQFNHHQDQAARLARAIDGLRELVDIGTRGAKSAPKPAKRKNAKTKKVAAAKSAPAKAPKAAKKANGKPTLSKALAYVLAEHQKAGSAGASAQQLMAGVGKAGFRFGSRKQANNMNYLYKTLRRNVLFKRTGDGQYTLA